jgi:hypothetical protein
VTRTPETIRRSFRDAIDILHVDEVTIKHLAEWNRISKLLEWYMQNIQNVPALEGACD